MGPARPGERVLASGRHRPVGARGSLLAGRPAGARPRGPGRVGGRGCPRILDVDAPGRPAVRARGRGRLAGAAGPSPPRRREGMGVDPRTHRRRPSVRSNALGGVHGRAGAGMGSWAGLAGRPWRTRPPGRPGGRAGGPRRRHVHLARPPRPHPRPCEQGCGQACGSEIRWFPPSRGRGYSLADIRISYSGDISIQNLTRRPGRGVAPRPGTKGAGWRGGRLGGVPTVVSPDTGRCSPWANLGMVDSAPGARLGTAWEGRRREGSAAAARTRSAVVEAPMGGGARPWW